MIDKKHRLPRIWSNRELRKVAHVFSGSVVNISGWKDQDKEGSYYRDYFVNADSYAISNYKADARGMQGMKDEFFLDLEQDLDEDQIKKFDVVFNHTTLEHIYEVRKAFSNLCSLASEAVIVVVPFLQQMHASYGDYWRLSPMAVERLFQENGFKLIYLSANEDMGASVYLFCIAVRNEEKWKGKIEAKIQHHTRRAWGDIHEDLVGARAICNTFLFRLRSVIGSLIKKK